jgi:putative flavoprotein involved in K+ transport
MRSITAIIIGAGQSGLAMSWHLSALGIEHVVLERGEVANAWQKDRWDSLHLLTPNWQSRLPGYAYCGNEPDGYMSMHETVGFLAGYAEHIRAPVEASTTVEHVSSAGHGFIVKTDRGEWKCKALVLATGACNRAAIPQCAASLPPGIQSLSPLDYKNPGQIAPGGVLIVGASASGVQLARELQQSGRRVYLATGEHVRVPRVYRGRDIKWWMDATGLLDVGLTDVDDIRRARHVPSLQLIGTPERATLNLNELQDMGVTITGRLMGISGSKLQFSGSLSNVCALGDLKMNRLLQGIDDWIEEHRLTDIPEASWRPAPTRVPNKPLIDLDLREAGIATVLWATGYRADYSWLQLPVLTPRGELRHHGGVVKMPGLYVLGLPFLRKRKSSLIDGTGDDAGVLSQHLHAYLNGSVSIAA